MRVRVTKIDGNGGLVTGYWIEGKTYQSPTMGFTFQVLRDGVKANVLFETTPVRKMRLTDSGWEITTQNSIWRVERL